MGLGTGAGVLPFFLVLDLFDGISGNIDAVNNAHKVLALYKSLI